MKIRIRSFNFWWYNESHCSFDRTSGEDATKDAKEHFTESYIKSKRFDEIYTNLKYRVILRFWRSVTLFDLY